MAWRVTELNECRFHRFMYLPAQTIPLPAREQHLCLCRHSVVLVSRHVPLWAGHLHLVTPRYIQRHVCGVLSESRKQFRFRGTSCHRHPRNTQRNYKRFILFPLVAFPITGATKCWRGRMHDQHKLALPHYLFRTRAPQLRATAMTEISTTRMLAARGGRMKQSDLRISPFFRNNLRIMSVIVFQYLHCESPLLPCKGKGRLHYHHTV